MDGYDCRYKIRGANDIPTGASTSVQCRDEHNLVAILQFIIALTLQLPVRVVDKDQNTRPPEEEINGKSVLSKCYRERTQCLSP